MDFKQAKAISNGRRVMFMFEHATCGDLRFAPMIIAAMAEYSAADPHGDMSEFISSNGVRISIENDPVLQGVTPLDAIYTLAQLTYQYEAGHAEGLRDAFHNYAAYKALPADEQAALFGAPPSQEENEAPQ